MRLSNSPALSYTEVLKPSLILPNGNVLMIGRCDEQSFSRAIQGYLRAHRKKQWYPLVQADLAGLDYTDSLSRWFALEVLQEKITLQWSQKEDAQAPGRIQVLS